MEDYPTAAAFITLAEAKQEMRALASSKPNIQERDYTIPNMAPEWWSYGKSTSNPLRGKVLIVPEANKMDQVASIWTGLPKSQCRRKDEPLSPYEYWNQNRDSLIKQVGERRTQAETAEALDNAIWQAVKGCGAFKPRVAAGVMQMFQAKRVLDFSSGWGDRLFAFISLDVDAYTGVDPNPGLHGPYQQMIDDLVPVQKRGRYTMIESPFQTAVLPRGLTYDLVFTSPPYFDLELYATKTDGGQNLDQWKSAFLYPSLDKAWEALEVGGHLALSINDFWGRGADAVRTSYVEDMVRYVSSLPGAHSLNSVYRGRCTPYIASSTGGDGTLIGAPIWCWRRTEIQSTDWQALSQTPVVIEPYQLDTTRVVNVIRDDLLPGTTKQRGALPYLASYPDYDEFVYAGQESGHGHLCIAFVANTLGKRATLFLSSVGTNPAMVERMNKSREYGARIYAIPDKLSVVTEEARKYCDRTKGALLVPLGMDNAEYQAQMVLALNAAIPSDLAPVRMWIVTGSGRVLRSLEELFPYTKFLSVRVGRELRNGDDATYVSKYKLSQEVKYEDLPPYPSSKTYDAKLWPYVKLHAQDGDYIWNVAGY